MHGVNTDETFVRGGAINLKSEKQICPELNRTQSLSQSFYGKFHPILPSGGLDKPGAT